MANFSRVLVGHDGGPHADDALTLGRLIAERSETELVLASVVPNPIGGSFVPALPVESADLQNPGSQPKLRSIWPEMARPCV